ncbi:hypothetical protein BRD17_01755 [Halobacteriales archaeon SW_7_68_16]|nr:MAG: hypothetical protein BRD17_01755 [Halobacteriales archaeon SW_7_68_16]
MTNRTDWTRLEPVSRNDDMREGLRAPVRDPMWFLARQWQVGEFQGEDAGSPARVDVDIAEDRLSRVDLRGGGRDTDPFEYGGDPLEATVERERILTDDDPPLQLRAETGQQFLRTLAESGYGEYGADAFPEALRLGRPGEALEAADRRYVELLAGRTLDGTAVAGAIRSAVRNADAVAVGEDDSWVGIATADLPTPEGASRTDAFDAAARQFYAWYVDLYEEPDAETGSAWNPSRLAYEFAVSTGGDATETVLEADEYRGGRLDWYHFSAADADATLDAGTDGETETDVVATDLTDTPDDPLTVADLTDVQFSTLRRSRSLVPTATSFPGMPAGRWWQFEEGDVSFARMTGEGSGLPRLLLTEFAIQYGNDWFEIALDTPVGTMTRIADLRVTDSFGVTERAKPAIDDDWQLFVHDLPDTGGDGDDVGLFLPPVLANSSTSDPIEAVTIARDEMANLAFAIERSFESPTGRAVDRTEFQPPLLTIDRVATDDDPDEEYVVLANPGEDRLVVDGYALVAATDGATTTVHEFTERTLDPGETVRIYTGQASEDDIGAGLSTSAWTAADAVELRDAGGRLTRKKLLAGPSDALADYRLSTDVPDYWFPFTPEQAWSFRLERALLLDASTLGVPVEQLPKPRGEILRPDPDLLPAGEDTYRIYDEAIPRGGREVTRRYQYARWTDGAGYLWSGRESAIDDTQLSTGLRFDVLEERS